jgi:hypothetical protein
LGSVALPHELTESPERRQLPPRAIAIGGLVIGVSIVIAVTLNRRLSTDVFWQLAAGQWMLSHHAVVGLDPFSYTESHHRWVADEWGSEVLLASFYKAFGVAAYNLIAIFTGTLCLISTALYARALGARGARLACISILVAFGIAGFVSQDRGLSFSLIWLPLELLILTKARTNPRWLLWLPPLCLVWVNTHGSILIGFMVIVVELAWSLTPTRLVSSIGGSGRSTYPHLIAFAGFGSVLASCVSPYGPRLLAYDLGVATNPQISKYIVEWKSPDFHSIGILICFLVPLAVFVFAVRRRGFMLLEVTLTAVFLVGTLHSARVLIYLYVAAAGLAVGLGQRRAFGPRARRITGAAAIGLIVALLAMPSVPAGTVTADTPVQAFNFLASHPGRIFTQYTWGDYSIARQRATFADGRTDLFTGKVLTEFFAVSNLTTNPDPILSAHGVDYVVWAKGTPLEVFLARDPRWVVVDRTAPAVVFARRATWDVPNTT